MRFSTIISQAPWRRKKEDTETQDYSRKEKRKSRVAGTWSPQKDTTQGARNEDANATAPVLDYKNWRISKVFSPGNSTNTIRHASPKRSASMKFNRRSIFRPNDPPKQGTQENGTDQPQDESLLKKLRRKSQNFTLPRPSTSDGVSKRRSFFGGRADGDDGEPPSLPALPSSQQRRPLSRHVPITIDHLQGDPRFEHGLEPGPGMAITTNDIQNADGHHEQPRSRPMSSSSSFSQLRLKPGRTLFPSPPTLEESESDQSDDDILTALPSLDFKDLSSLELKSPALYNSGQYAPVDRHIIQRATPKVVDIVAPRPMSMFSTQSTKQEPATRAARTRSMVQAATTSPIGPPEDGPKGDWTRTRHSWLGVGGEEGRPEQLEWDKLKQFIEAFGTGHDGGVVSMVRQVDDSGDSSNSSEDANHANKHSNAQALAALEFGLS